jgi:hypothetical protein
MRLARAFVLFLYDFAVGEDPLAFLAVVAALGATALLAHGGVDVWWLLPLAVAAVLAATVWRASRPPRR